MTNEKKYASKITAAKKSYDASVSMFSESERNIDVANASLEVALAEINTEIETLSQIRQVILSDIERNTSFKETINKIVGK